MEQSAIIIIICYSLMLFLFVRYKTLQLFNYYNLLGSYVFSCCKKYKALQLL